MQKHTSNLQPGSGVLSLSSGERAGVRASLIPTLRTCLIHLLWLFSLPAASLHAQSPPAAQQDPLMSLMMSQPKLDTTSPVIATASFEPQVIHPGEQSIYRVSLNALEESIEWIARPGGSPAARKMRWQ